MASNAFRGIGTQFLRGDGSSSRSIRSSCGSEKHKWS